MIYLYGLINVPKLPSNALLEMTGLQFVPMEVSLGCWSLVYEVHDGSDVEPRRRQLLAHTRVVERMMQFGTVLPARFGLVAQSIEMVAKLVEEKAASIAEEFEKLRNCVELGLRVSYPREAALAATLQSDPALLAQRARLVGQGAEAYFARAEFGRRLAEALDIRRGVAQKAIISALRSQLKDFVLRSPETDVEVLRMEVLVHASQEERIAAMLDELARCSNFAPSSEPLIQIVGPAPVYNFVKLSLAVDHSAAEEV